MGGFVSSGLTSCFRRKFQRVPNCQLGEMNIHFGLVYAFAPEILVHLLH